MKKLILLGLTGLLVVAGFAISALATSFDLTPVSELKARSQITITGGFYLDPSKSKGYNTWVLYVQDGRVFDSIEQRQHHQTYDYARKRVLANSPICQLTVSPGNRSNVGGTLYTQILLFVPEDSDSADRRFFSESKEKPLVSLRPTNYLLNQIQVRSIVCEKGQMDDKFSVSDLEMVFDKLIEIEKR
jgi:hypothetical protein